MERDEDWIFPAILIAGATIAFAILISMATGYPARPNGVTSLKAAVIFLTVATMWRILRHIWSLWSADVEHPIAQLRADARPALIGFAPVLIGVAIVTAFLYSITFLKSMIAAVIPFWADGLFATMDRAIFVSPAGLARALEPALPGLGLFYGLWHVVNLGGIMWVLHWRGHNKSRHVLDFKALLASAFGFLSIIAISILSFGLTSWLDWLQSMDNFHAVLVKDNVLGVAITPAAAAAHLQLPPTPFLVAGVLGGIWLIVKCRKLDPLPLSAAIAASSLLAAPYALTYDLAPLVPFLVLSAFQDRKSPAVALAGVLNPLPLLLTARLLSERVGEDDIAQSVGAAT